MVFKEWFKLAPWSGGVQWQRRLGVWTCVNVGMELLGSGDICGGTEEMAAEVGVSTTGVDGDNSKHLQMQGHNLGQDQALVLALAMTFFNRKGGGIGGYSSRKCGRGRTGLLLVT